MLQIIKQMCIRDSTNSATPPFTFGYSYKGGLVRPKQAFQSVAMVQDGKQLSALKVLMEETERAKRFGFTQSELDRACLLYTSRCV